MSTVESLAQVSDAFILIQSFQGDSLRPVPSLWSARLGVKPARDLWKRQGGRLWWQAWSLDGEAYLILPVTLMQPQGQRAPGQRFGHLVIIGSDQLHGEQLKQRIESASSQSGALVEDGLFQSCLSSLSRRPSVYWTADALASVSGALAPLLQQGREGCLQLRLVGNALQWSGVIGQRPLRTNPVMAQLVQWSLSAGDADATDGSSVLRVDGSALQLILGTLLSRQIIQVPLEENYGISEVLRSRISASAFSLRLVSQSSGPYRAGLQLQIPVASDQASWNSVLAAVTKKLKGRGYGTLQPMAEPTGPSPQLWFKADDPTSTVIGGWRWIKTKNQQLLSVGLGSEPDKQPFLRDREGSHAASLVVEADPSTLAAMDLLSGRWPKPITNATKLTFQLKPLAPDGPSRGVWRLQGQLSLP